MLLTDVQQWPSQITQLIKEKTMSPRMRFAKGSILVAAAISFLLSVYLWFSGSQEQGIFVGIWVPSILSFGALMFSGNNQS